MSVHSYYREKKVSVKISQLLSYPYQQFQLISHLFHEVFTLTLVPSDNLSYFNENKTNFPKFPLNLHSANLSLSTETYYKPVKFLTFNLYVRKGENPQELHVENESSVSVCQLAKRSIVAEMIRLSFRHYNVI